VKALAVLLIILLTTISGSMDNPGGDGPKLEISSVSGNLEQERDSALAIRLYNNASYLAEAEKTLQRSEDARAIVAELKASDDRIEVLSSPQVAGSLAPGENRTLEFMVRSEDADVGIYPLQLILRYSRLSNLTTVGEESFPGIVFTYENVSLDFPLQARVVQGPRIELEELKGKAVSGKESELEIYLVNRGDEPALDLLLETYPQPPFLSTQGANERLVIKPDGSAKANLLVYTDENATPGYYALPCQISYRDGNNRRQDLPLLVYVERDEYFRWLLSAAGLLVLVGGSLVLKRYLPKKKRQHRRL
jgi:hypothetical protein